MIKNLIIIGEAAAHLSEDFVEMHHSLPWREMRDMRNIVVHEYFGIDRKIVWETLERNLAPLVPQLKQLILTKGSEK